jgi:hypothetical protein
MKKLPIILGIAVISFLFGLSFSSAYYYGGYVGGYGPYADSYDYNAYSSVRSSGGYYGGQTTATNYAKATTSGWEGGSYVTKTVYTKTTAETPNYGYGSYGGYGNYGYYDQPWYPKYWDSRSYYPRDYYVNNNDYRNYYGSPYRYGY